MNLGNNLSPPIYHLFTFLVRTIIGRFFLFRFPVRISLSCMRLSHSFFRVPPRGIICWGVVCSGFWKRCLPYRFYFCCCCCFVVVHRHDHHIIQSISSKIKNERTKQVQNTVIMMMKKKNTTLQLPVNSVVLK